MSAIGVPWLVLTTSGSAAKTGVVAFAQMGAYVLTQFLAGPIVDRGSDCAVPSSSATSSPR
jgi:hypothetical protein